MLMFYFVVVDDSDVFDVEEFVASSTDAETFDAEDFFAGAFDSD